MTEPWFLALVAAALLAQAAAQPGANGRDAGAPTAPETPTASDIERIWRTSDGYVRIVARTLAWRDPASPACQELRRRVEINLPTMGLAPATPIPDDPRTRVEIYQRAEENAMTRHSVLSQSVYEAASRDCLVLPEPDRGAVAVGPDGNPQRR